MHRQTGRRVAALQRERERIRLIVQAQPRFGSLGSQQNNLSFDVLRQVISYVRGHAAMPQNKTCQ